jgi:hypothetical protein
MIHGTGLKAWSRLISSTLRHLFAFMRGENQDPETGRSHLAHAICGLLFLLEYTFSGAGNDDRHITEPENKSPAFLDDDKSA